MFLVHLGLLSKMVLPGGLKRTKRKAKARATLVTILIKRAPSPLNCLSRLQRCALKLSACHSRVIQVKEINFQIHVQMIPIALKPVSHSFIENQKGRVGIVDVVMVQTGLTITGTDILTAHHINIQTIELDQSAQFHLAVVRVGIGTAGGVHRPVGHGHGQGIRSVLLSLVMELTFLLGSRGVLRKVIL